MRTFTLTELTNSVGTDLGPTSWHVVHQHQIDLFAEATGDRQWLHVDPERAAHGPYGATVAHGYMTLAVLARLLPELFTVEGVAMTINYGLNKVRFPAPVVVGTHIRAHATVTSVEHIDPAIQLTLAAAIEARGQPEPACAAEAIVRLFPRP